MKITPQILFWMVAVPLLLWLLGSRDGGDGVTPAVLSVVTVIAAIFAGALLDAAGAARRPVLQLIIIAVGITHIAVNGYLPWGVL